MNLEEMIYEVESYIKARKGVDVTINPHLVIGSPYGPMLLQYAYETAIAWKEENEKSKQGKSESSNK